MLQLTLVLYVLLLEMPESTYELGLRKGECFVGISSLLKVLSQNLLGLASSTLSLRQLLFELGYSITDVLSLSNANLIDSLRLILESVPFTN